MEELRFRDIKKMDYDDDMPFRYVLIDLLYKKQVDVNFVLSCYTDALDKERHLNTMRFNEAQEAKQAYFIEGYHQAEKDNELTWKDIEKICLIAREVHQFRGFWSESVYQEVLEQFKEKKENG